MSTPTRCNTIQLLEPIDGQSLTIDSDDNSASVTEGGRLALIEGQTHYHVLFGTSKLSAEYDFTESDVVSTDESYLLLAPSMTERTVSGFMLDLDGEPDSDNYIFNWRVRVNALEESGGSGGEEEDSDTPLRSRTTAATIDPVVVKTTAGSIYGYNFVNTNAYPVYVKFYNTSTPTVGTTDPVRTMVVPEGDPGFLVYDSDSPIQDFTAAMSFAVTKELSDADTTDIDVGILAEVSYL